jgi:hypothetical protein
MSIARRIKSPPVRWLATVSGLLDSPDQAARV